MEYTKQGYEKAAKSFNPADLDVDLSKRHIMVTGANSGIGKVTALEGNGHFILKAAHLCYYIILIQFKLPNEAPLST